MVDDETLVKEKRWFSRGASVESVSCIARPMIYTSGSDSWRARPITKSVDLARLQSSSHAKEGLDKPLETGVILSTPGR